MAAYKSKDEATLLLYGGYDAIATARVYAAMRREMTSARQEALYAHNKELSRIAAKMHSVGFGVNAEKRAYLAWGLEQEYDDKLEILQELVGIEGFTGTVEQMKSLIWKRHATPKVSRFNLPDPLDDSMWNERHDALSVDYGTLLQLVTNPGMPDDMKAIIDAYWNADEVWKLRSTFVVSELVDQAIGADGRLRAGWNSLGADTGRWTCSKPNILNLKQFVRHMYCAAPGKVLVHADFSQQELWVMAAVAGDKKLFENLATGDVYTADAIDWFGLPTTTTKKTMKASVRATAKGSHLARQYGAGDKTSYLQMLSEIRTITFKQVCALGKKFLDTYSGTASYWEDEMQRIARNGFASTRIMDRRKVFPRMPERSQGVNFSIQGTAADISNLAIIDIDARLKERRGAVHVHTMYDSNDIEVYENDVDWAVQMLKDCMSQPFKVNGYVLEIPLECKISTSWGDL